MVHSYKSEYPRDTIVLDGIYPFFEAFYQTSDAPDAHEEYAGFFTEDATFVLASKTAKSREAILAMRRAAWTRVSARRHTVEKIFPFGHSASEFMLQGTVEYEFKDGGKAAVDWAARAELVREGAEMGWKFRYYQVYLDTAAQTSAK